MTASGRAGGVGGSGGAGGNGGQGSGAPGGNGGAGGRAAYYSGGGGSGGSGGALSLESHGAVNLTNVTISGNSTFPSAGGATGGSGGNGGSGGSGSSQGNGGAGGNAGSGGDAGASGSGAGISMPYYTGTESPALTIYYNTIVLNSIAIPSGSGGLAGGHGIGGAGTIRGANGSDGIAGDAPINGHGGGISRSAGSVALSATILADNLAGSNYINCYSAYMTNYISGGWNLIGDTTGCPIVYSEDDLHDGAASPLNLGPLALNWRMPYTHALLPDSIAIDWVQPGEANCDDMVPSDARGVRRPINYFCDVGAYEVGSMNYLPLIKK